MENILEDYKMECCRLNLPEGLKELMSDISREVLRAQPPDIYGFIAGYLSALLVTRDNLSVASQLCNYVCECESHPELLNELEDIGLDEVDAGIAQDIIMKHFKKEKVNEGNLLAALLARTKIDASRYPDVVNAVRAAYVRHQAHTATNYEKPLESKNDEVAAAASHTLDLYRQAGPPDGLYGEMATKIQASYRAYGVRRDIAAKAGRPTDSSTNLSVSEPKDAVVTSHKTSISDDVRDEIELTASMQQKRENTASSISLAGSICAMPQNRPYTVQDIECLTLLEETEKEHAHIDYTVRSPHVSVVSTDGNRFSTNSNKRISFRNVSQEELFYDQTLYDDHAAANDVAATQEVKQEDDYDDERSESSEETIFEEIVEFGGLDGEEFEEGNVEDVDIQYVNVTNMEADSGDDQDPQ